MWLPSLGWEDPLEQEKATHSSILAWKIPWTEEPGRLQSMRSRRVRHDLETEHIHILLLLLFSRQVVSDSLRPNELQYTRLLCPLLSPRVCSDSCTLSQGCHPTISSSRSLFLSPSIFPSIRIFSSELTVHIWWPKYWSFSLSIGSSNYYSGFISFKIDSFDLLAVQGTLKSLLQHHSSKVSVLWCSAFFMFQLSHLYMTPGKTIALTIQTFVGKVISLLFNTLSRFVIAFLPRSRLPLISWLQSPSALIWKPKTVKSIIVSPPICHEVM